MKLLFLDFDGVLNSTNKTREENLLSGRKHKINQVNLNNLKTLVEKENYQIVISSTWRKDPSFIEEAKNAKDIVSKFIKLFEEYGWKDAPIIDITANLSGFRGQEIAVYLDSLKNENMDYIILDDDNDFFLESIMSFSLAKLDRLEIRSLEEAQAKSKYWSYQKLFKIDSTTGLTRENVQIILEANTKKNNFKIKV